MSFMCMNPRTVKHFINISCKKRHYYKKIYMQFLLGIFWNPTQKNSLGS